MAPDSISERVPAATPLPDTSTSATSRGALRVSALTTKSPENGPPPAGLTRASARHPPAARAPRPAATAADAARRAPSRRAARRAPSPRGCGTPRRTAAAVASDDHERAAAAPTQPALQAGRQGQAARDHREQRRASGTRQQQRAAEQRQHLHARPARPGAPQRRLPGSSDSSDATQSSEQAVRSDGGSPAHRRDAGAARPRTRAAGSQRCAPVVVVMSAGGYRRAGDVRRRAGLADRAPEQVPPGHDAREHLGAAAPARQPLPPVDVVRVVALGGAACAARGPRAPS